MDKFSRWARSVVGTDEYRLFFFESLLPPLTSHFGDSVCQFENGRTFSDHQRSLKADLTTLDLTN